MRSHPVHHHSPATDPITWAVGAGVGLLDGLAFLADVNAGTIATAITCVGGALVGVMYLGIRQYGEARAYAHAKWLEANKDSLLDQLDDVRHALDMERDNVRINSLRIDDLETALRDRQQFIITLQESNQELNAEILDLISPLLREKGFVVESSSTRTEISVKSSDDIPTVPGEAQP